MLVGRVGEDAGAQRERRTVRRRGVATDERAQDLLIGQIGIAQRLERIDGFVEMVIAADLETGIAVDREPVIAPFGNGQIEDRETSPV